MSRDRFDQSIVRELEEELRQALSLEPSPDFARQVRARIDGRRGPIDAWATWRLPLAAAALCILAVGLGWRLIRGPVDSSVVPTSRVGTDVALSDHTAPVVGPEPDDTVSDHSTAAPGRLQRRPHPKPVEVLVPQDAARAVARLLALSRSGAVDEESLRPVTSVVPATLDVAPIVVPSIPLTDIDIQTGPAPGASQE